MRESMLSELGTYSCGNDKSVDDVDLKRFLNFLPSPSVFPLPLPLSPSCPPLSLDVGPAMSTFEYFPENRLTK